MTKKNVIIPSPSPEPSPGPEQAPEPLGYTIGTWGNHPRWACDLCPFDTLDGLPVMLAHIAEAHTPQPEPEPAPLITIFDKWGNPVNS